MKRRRGRRSSRPWYPYLFGVLAAAFIALGITALGASASSTTRTSTEVVTAENGVVQTTVSGTGNVEPTVDDDVNFETSGTLATMDVKVGEHVKKGQLIATLDPSSAESTLEEAEETLSSAKDSLTEAEDGDSSSSSSTTGNSTTTTKTVSASAVAQAEAEVESDEATVDADQKAVDETKLYAPVSGTIAATAGDAIGDQIDAGSSSTASSASADASSSTDSSSSSSSGFVTLINSKTLTMTVSLSEDDISSVRVGQIATVDMTALSGVELAAKVTSISPLGTTSDGVTSYDVTVTTTQSNPKVLPGMSATAEIVTGQAQGVTVPTEAVSGSGSNATVELDTNGKVTSEPVTVGLAGTSRDVITSGLKAGQDVRVTVDLPSLSTGSTTSTTSSSSETRRASFGGGFAGGGTSGGAPSFGGGAP